jgi:hypothetical protein
MTMLRHEYVDHVAALCMAQLATQLRGTIVPKMYADTARDALAYAEALADLRYPESRYDAAALPCGRGLMHDGECNGATQPHCRKVRP